MNDHDLEQAVLAYLERPVSDASLTPAAFAQAYNDEAAAVRDAIESVLTVERDMVSTSGPRRSIGGYTVLGELGRGGMGIVYRVEADGVERALKLLPLAPLVGPRMLERFRREAEALARLSHPHIVRVHATGMHDEMPFLVMDLVEGRSLDQCGREMDCAAVVALVATLADTLEASHRQGVLHRDVKPQNVLVRPDGSPVLLDFGLSVLEDASSLTLTGELVGTPRYMAPEQVSGGEVDARTDVHALGLMLYELLAGAPVHAVQGRDAVIASVRSGSIVPPRALNPAIGRDLERVIVMALATEPARRYASAEAFADDLRHVQNGEPIQAPRLRPAQVMLVKAGLHAIARGWSRAWRGVTGSSERASDLSPSSHRDMALLLDRAVGQWIDGAREQALTSVLEAQRRDPSDPTALVLAAHLAGRNLRSLPPELAPALETLRGYESGEHRETAAAVHRGALAALHPSLTAAVLGLSSARSNPADAIESLTAATRMLPEVRALPLALAQACRRAGRHEDAVRALRRCTELAPDSVTTWTDLAEELIEQRALTEADEALQRAQTLAPVDDSLILRCRAKLEIHNRRQPEARALLTAVLERMPDDVDALYHMAFSYDMDHDMIAAVSGYGDVLKHEPGHGRALLLLAHLHSGASRGQCGGCDTFFAAHPEYYDLAVAEQYLLRSLEADRGADEWLTRTARDVAMRLERRDAVVGLLARLTSTDERTSSVLRLEEVLRRLQQVER